MPLQFPACAEAVNSSAKETSADFLLLVAGTLQPEEGWLEPLLRAFAFLPRVGAVCPEVVAGPPAAESDGLVEHTWKAAWPRILASLRALGGRS